MEGVREGRSDVQGSLQQKKELFQSQSSLLFRGKGAERGLLCRLPLQCLSGNFIFACLQVASLERLKLQSSLGLLFWGQRLHFGSVSSLFFFFKKLAMVYILLVSMLLSIRRAILHFLIVLKLHIDVHQKKKSTFASEILKYRGKCSCQI